MFSNEGLIDPRRTPSVEPLDGDSYEPEDNRKQ
jgi:hypothetical protein